MKNLPAIALATVAAAALGGTALAATHTKPNSSPNGNHVMNVALPGGGVAHIEYVGDVAPRVTIQPGVPMAAGWDAPFAPFAGFDRMMADMNRQTEAMVRQTQEMSRQAGAMPGAPTLVSLGNAPAGASSSTTIVSYSNGGSTCTRTTESISQGPGKPPKVTSSVSGNCAAPGAPPQPAPSAAPINRT